MTHHKANSRITQLTCHIVDKIMTDIADRASEGCTGVSCVILDDLYCNDTKHSWRNIIANEIRESLNTQEPKRKEV